MNGVSLHFQTVGCRFLLPLLLFIGVLPRQDPWSHKLWLWSSRTLDRQEHILQTVNDDLGISIRQVVLACRTYHSTVFRAIQMQLLYPYLLQRVQVLRLLITHRERTCPMIYCPNWRFVGCLFRHVYACDRITNLQLWAYWNPHCTMNDRQQNLFTNKVRDGIVGDCLVDQYVLLARVIGAVYMGFISKTRPDKLEYIPLIKRNACRSCMIKLQHIYSCYPYFSRCIGWHLPWNG